MSNAQDNTWIERSIDATGPNAADLNAATDTDAAALTETWAAFSGLLEKSQPPLDESALVSAVHSRVARRERSRRRWQIGAVGLAFAATLLVAMSLVRFSRNGAEVALAPQDGAVAAGGNVAPDVDEDPMLAWDDDEWSNSLAAAHREALQLETNWRQPTDALAIFRNRLDALQQEIEDSSL